MLSPLLFSAMGAPLFDTVTVVNFVLSEKMLQLY